MKISKIVLLIICVSLLSINLCSCGERDTVTSENDNISFNLTNTIENQISGITANWYIDGVDTGNSSGIAATKEDKYLGKDTSLSFYFYKSDVSNEKMLEKLSVVIKVTDSNGGTFDAVTLDLPSKFGDKYYYSLVYKDGCYSLIKS